MEKIKQAIINHKGLFIVGLLALILFIVVTVIFISLFFFNSSSVYGDRLDGIEEVKISDDTLDNISSKMEENENVSSCECRIQGKIVYINMTFNAGVKIDTAKEIANNLLTEFDEEQLSYYDFSFFLKEETEEENGFLITGNKHPKVDNIGWIKS